MSKRYKGSMTVLWCHFLFLNGAVIQYCLFYSNYIDMMQQTNFSNLFFSSYLQPSSNRYATDQSKWNK